MTAENLDAVEAEAVADDGSVTVTLADTAEIRVKPVKEWRASGIRAMREGDFDTWAEKALDADSYEAWTEVDPTMQEVEDFFTAWGELTGQDQGKSRNSGRSSKSTRRK